MASSVSSYAKQARDFLVELAQHQDAIKKLVPTSAHGTVDELLRIQKIEVSSEIGEAGFRLSQNGSQIEINYFALEMIREAGRYQRRVYGGMEETTFNLVSIGLFLPHEAAHISQNLVEFSEVQVVKRVCGSDKLGQLDLLADTTAAQIFAAWQTARGGQGRERYLIVFAEALAFMIRFCFPAFKFPLDKPHKGRRGVGIVIMLARVLRALQRGDHTIGLDAPIYPCFSDDFTEAVIWEYPESKPHGVIRAIVKLEPETTVQLLKNLDCGNLEWILEKVLGTFA